MAERKKDNNSALIAVAPLSVEAPPSRFHNLSDGELADELGRFSEIERATGAELLGLKADFKSRGLVEARGAVFVVQRLERYGRRLDTARLRAHFGAEISTFETPVLSIAVVIHPLDLDQGGAD